MCSWALCHRGSARPAIPRFQGLFARHTVCDTGRVLPRDKDYARAARRVETLLEAPQTADEAIEATLEASIDLLAIIGSCWHQSDPATGMPMTSGMLGEPAGSFEESLVYEFERPDVSLFRDLQTRRTPVAAISMETQGRVSASARFREMIEPEGPADELRVSLRDSFGVWSALCIFSARRMTQADVAYAAAVAPLLTRAIRRATGAEADTARRAARDPGGPSVLILDPVDRILTADATARTRLARLPEFRDVEVPGIVAFLAAHARWDRSGAPATVRTRTLDGEWFTLDASRLDDGTHGSVAVVIQPSAPDAVLDAVLRSRGLSTREREVAALIIQGRSAKAIASTLVISPWTVQDHMKAIYEKTGVGDRYALAALTS
jgi:DNA-binding CsgD family transcriptional regulator